MLSINFSATCNGTLGSECLTCSASNHRTESSNYCPCDNLFYDDGTHAMC